MPCWVCFYEAVSVCVICSNKTLVDLLELFLIAGMMTSKVGKRFAFKGLKALSEILIRCVYACRNHVRACILFFIWFSLS